MPRLVGRERERRIIERSLRLGQHLLIEGPVGVGKTFLATTLLRELGIRYHRVDGDSRFTEQKLTGWFDPPLVLERGYRRDCFIEGPLLEAMLEGSVLFINELNRMPEGVQNILLPVLDEGVLQVPKLGGFNASPGFVVIATQNPSEYIATQSLSEAALDRFESVHLDYQSRQEELEILRGSAGENGNSSSELEEYVVDLVRETRLDDRLERGASIRAGISLLRNLRQSPDALSKPDEMIDLLHLSFKNRIRFHGDRQMNMPEWCKQLLVKKKPS